MFLKKTFKEEGLDVRKSKNPKKVPNWEKQRKPQKH